MPEDYCDMQKLISELKVHQIELEIQNAELRSTQQELQRSWDYYFDFYNFSPVGYFTFDKNGSILDANITSAIMLGQDRKPLMNLPFRNCLSPEYIPAFEDFCKNSSSSKCKQTCELKLYSSQTHVLLEGKSVPDDAGNRKTIRAVMVDITEMKEMEKKLELSRERYINALNSSMHLLLSALEIKMPTFTRHRQTATRLARAIAEEMDLPETSIEAIRVAGPILDLGYISVPAELLGKLAFLTGIEYEIIKTHVRIGYDLLKDVEFPWPVAQILLQHHEKIDGSGYPDGISGDNILIESRIFAVANDFEEIACDQPYRPSLGIEKAIEEIEKNRGILYDSEVVEACLKLFRQKGFTLCEA